MINRDTEWLAMCDNLAGQLANTQRGRYMDPDRLGREVADIVDAIFRQRDARDLEDQQEEILKGIDSKAKR